MRTRTNAILAALVLAGAAFTLSACGSDSNSDPRAGQEQNTYTQPDQRNGGMPGMNQRSPQMDQQRGDQRRGPASRPNGNGFSGNSGR